MGLGNGKDGGLSDEIFWGSAVRVRHPVRGKIIKILSQSNQPLSAADLSPSFEEKHLALLEYHLRQLFKVEIVAQANHDEKPNGGVPRMRTYRLAQ